MDIFKLIYQHDIRLDQLKGRHSDRSAPETSMSIEDFMKPDPTYTKFYFTGTRPGEEKFGLNTLKNFDSIVDALSESLKSYSIYSGNEKLSLARALDSVKPGKAMILTTHGENQWNTEELTVDSDSNVGHKKDAIAKLLRTDDLLLYKEQAHNGYDLHLFSQNNIYRQFFYPLQKLVSDQFRFFSMNGKRITSERKFYFETWSLDRPPHGIEEVFEETVL